MKKTIASLLLAAALAVPAVAQTPYVPTPENIASREEFADMKLGIFLHWGIYSTFAQGEWYLQNAVPDRNEYAKAADAFYPHRFDAEKWVKAFKDAGAGYVTFTSRHHDGFSMWKSDQSAYNIVDATPYGRDVIAQLADACHAQDMRLHFYYSHIDWGRDDYPMGRTGKNVGKDVSKADYNHYLKFMNAQLTELLTRYGKIGAIWFDGVWDHDQDSVPFDWHLREQYDLIHNLQPACLVGNNHHGSIIPGEDIQIFERDLPGENTTGWVQNGTQVSVSHPLETCTTMNNMWGYKVVDQNYKSVEEILHLLIKTSGMGANLLLNIGPQPNGELPAIALERLKGVGEWMREYGESIYGTTAGDFKPAEGYAATRKGNKQYIHITDNSLAGKSIELPVKGKVKLATEFASGAKVAFKQAKDNTLTLTIPEHAPVIDYIIVLQ